MPWRRLCEASESLEQQQDSRPRHAKHKPENRQAINGAFASLPHSAETAGNGSEKAKRHYKPSSGKPKTMRSQPFHTVPKLQLRSRKKKHWQRTVADKQPITCTDTKMKLVGNGSEKAKHHNRPSSGKPKTQARKNASRPLWNP